MDRRIHAILYTQNNACDNTPRCTRQI
jgi:hypothetical protein